MTRYLVTGGAGFIGSHLVDRLLDAGHEVVALDDLSTGREDNLEAARANPAFRLVEADITTEAAGDAVAEARPEAVLHLAAQIDVRRSVADPLRDAEVNVLGTVRLLEASRRAGVAKVVFTTSGGCVYGEPPEGDLPVGEDYPGHPHSPYGASKRGVEEYFHAYEALYGLRWTSLALANVYGPRQDPGGEAGVVSIFAGRLLAGQPVTIYGDGEQTRDFVYVDDVVEAFVAALGGGDGLRVNIGTAEQVSVNALYRELALLAGRDASPSHEPERAGELRRIAVDNSRAGRELGWGPKTSLREGLAATLDWVRETTSP